MALWFTWGLGLEHDNKAFNEFFVIEKRDAGGVSFLLYVGCILLVGKSLVGLSHFLEDTGVLLGNDNLDDQQGSDHQDNGDN